MRRQQPIPEFQALTADQRDSVETWFDDGTTYLKIKERMLSQFGIQVSKDKIARQYHLWVAAQEFDSTVEEFIKMLNAADLDLEKEGLQAMLQKAFMLTLAPNPTPARLLQLLKIFDYENRRTIQQTRALLARSASDRAERRLALQEARQHDSAPRQAPVSRSKPHRASPPNPPSRPGASVDPQASNPVQDETVQAGCVEPGISRDPQNAFAPQPLYLPQPYAFIERRCTNQLKQATSAVPSGVTLGAICQLFPADLGSPNHLPPVCVSR